MRWSFTITCAQAANDLLSASNLENMGVGTTHGASPSNPSPDANLGCLGMAPGGSATDVSNPKGKGKGQKGLPQFPKPKKARKPQPGFDNLQT